MESFVSSSAGRACLFVPSTRAAASAATSAAEARLRSRLLARPRLRPRTRLRVLGHQPRAVTMGETVARDPMPALSSVGGVAKRML